MEALQVGDKVMTIIDGGPEMVVSQLPNAAGQVNIFADEGFGGGAFPQQNWITCMWWTAQQTIMQWNFPPNVLKKVE